MSRYFDWTASLKRFVRFDTARSEDVNDALDELTAGLDDLDLDVNRSIKLPSGTADQTLALGAGARANKVLAFDGSGNITVSTNDVDSSGASAVAAAASASAAASSASAASGSASAASASASAAAASFDNFDDRYLVAKASDPTLDNDGAALLTGALYWNSVSNAMRVYTGSAWVDVNSVTAAQISDSTATGRAVLTAVDAAAVRTAIGAGTGSGDVLIGTAQTLTAPKRGTVTTDNDLSFDLNVTNNFACTTSGSGTLTFTNITAGQSGFILLTNASNHAISATATTKVSSTLLTRISASGTYLLSYFSDGTNVYVVASEAFA